MAHYVTISDEGAIVSDDGATRTVWQIVDSTHNTITLERGQQRRVYLVREIIISATVQLRCTWLE